ncbi:MAG: hypothetical protein K2X27_04830 [Candidatus Obscuribacterales bacterium]|nr:hypothetical protein [Candidatus Obscuribacterales bacterium]
MEEEITKRSASDALENDSRFQLESWSQDSSKSRFAPEPSKAPQDGLGPLELVDEKSREANPFLARAASEAVNKPIYSLPRWASLPKPSPNLGCVSSFSNRYRQALSYAGIINSVDDTAYRNYYQVNMDELNKKMGSQAGLLKPISKAELKEGDLIQGSDPGTTRRHMGIVGSIENGSRMVYDNYGGLWRKEPLDHRFGSYKELNYYRAFLPKK